MLSFFNKVKETEVIEGEERKRNKDFAAETERKLEVEKQKFENERKILKERVQELEKERKKETPREI